MQRSTDLLIRKLPFARLVSRVRVLMTWVLLHGQADGGGAQTSPSDLPHAHRRLCTCWSWMPLLPRVDVDI